MKYNDICNHYRQPPRNNHTRLLINHKPVRGEISYIISDDNAVVSIEWARLHEKQPAPFKPGNRVLVEILVGHVIGARDQREPMPDIDRVTTLVDWDKPNAKHRLGIGRVVTSMIIEDNTRSADITEKHKTIIRLETPKDN